MPESRWKALGALLLTLLLALPAVGRRVDLDVDVQTPVYRMPDGLPLPDDSLRYKLSWSGIPLGGVEVAMAPTGAGDALEVAIRGATLPAFSWLYNLRFTAEGRVRTAPFKPGGFSFESCEGRRHKRTEILFPEEEAEGPIRGFREKHGRTTEYFFHSDNSYDVPSAVWLMLNLDYEPGQEYQLDAFTGETRYLVNLVVEAREQIEVGDQPVDTLRLYVTTHDLNEEDIDRKHRGTRIWMSEQRPRRVLRARTKTFVGSVNLDLAPARRPIDARCS